MRCSQLSRMTIRRRSARASTHPAHGVARRELGRLVEQVRFAQAQRAEHGLRDVGGVGDHGQLDQPDAVGDVVDEYGRRLDSQAGLARPAGPDQGDQPALLEHLADARHLILAADETGQLRTQVGAWRAGRRPRRLAPQHREMDRLQFRRRVDAEFVGQPLPHSLVGREGIGLAAHLGQRAHPQAGDALVERMLLGQRVEFGDDLARVAEGEVGLDAVLRRGQAQVAQARGGRRGERGVLDVGENRPAPQGERFAQRPRRLARLAPAQGRSAGARPVARSGSRRCRRARRPAGTRPPTARCARRRRGLAAIARSATAARWPRPTAARRPTRRRSARPH